jgi:hypothetical protein
MKFANIVILGEGLENSLFDKSRFEQNAHFFKNMQELIELQQSGPKPTKSNKKNQNHTKSHKINHKR